MTLQPGDQIDHYTIVQKLGHGGMSEVYLANDAVQRREVVLKFPHEDAGRRLPRPADPLSAAATLGWQAAGLQRRRRDPADRRDQHYQRDGQPVVSPIPAIKRTFPHTSVVRPDSARYCCSCRT